MNLLEVKRKSLGYHLRFPDGSGGGAEGSGGAAGGSGDPGSGQGSGEATSCTLAAALSGAVSGCFPATFNGGGWGEYLDGSEYLPTASSISGVYSGSLSAQGNLVAMQLNTGARLAVDSVTGLPLTPTVRTVVNEDGATVTITTWPDGSSPKFIPYLTGYFREYWQDPRAMTFGADSAMPALTGVMPAQYTTMPGNFNYYMDLQLIRLTGSNVWDTFHFINVFYQAQGWVYTVNDYLAALQAAETTNFPYYGASNYSSLISQNMGKYKTGKALTQAIKNLGRMVTCIPDGKFGTSNSVAKVMLDAGLGAVGGLSNTLEQAGVNFSDIYNTTYTAIITQTLQAITNPADLVTIQSVMGSTIPNMLNPLDYISIERASGLSNDSEFSTFADMGLDLFEKAPNFSLSTGLELAALIDSVQSDVGTRVEGLASSTNMLTPGLIAALRTYLPQTSSNSPISLINVIGAASGYLNDPMSLVNNGMEQLFATSYGPQIRSVLTEISRADGKFSLSAAEEAEANRNVNYWKDLLTSKKAEYYTLLNKLVSDKTGNIPVIVKQINDNYAYVCQQLYYEFNNYNKANITIDSFPDNNQIFSFVSALPEFGADPNNIGTDYMLYGMCQDNQAGDTIKSILAQAKNNQLFGEAGIKPTGTL